VSDLATVERIGYHADCLAPGGERRVGDRVHKTHAITFVDEADAVASPAPGRATRPPCDTPAGFRGFDPA
jgi:hypothetical protein